MSRTVCRGCDALTHAYSPAKLGFVVCAQGGGGAASGSGASVARPVATSYNEMTSAMITEMSAQLARMGQLAIDVENLKTRNAVLEAELAQVNRVRVLTQAASVHVILATGYPFPFYCLCKGDLSSSVQIRSFQVL